jgi:hypothetical protein
VRRTNTPTSEASSKQMVHEAQTRWTRTRS